MALGAQAYRNHMLRPTDMVSVNGIHLYPFGSNHRASPPTRWNIHFMSMKIVKKLGQNNTIFLLVRVPASMSLAPKLT